MKKIKPMAFDKVHETVLYLLKHEERNKVLDLGSGEGALVIKMQKMGFDITASDINKKNFKAKTNFKLLDLNKKFPFEKNLFDLVTCVEVIEHLENPHHIFREINKVLKREGTLILTTPNIEHYWSKILFLFINRFFLFFWDKPFKRQKEFGHINPISFLELDYLTKIYGFKIVKKTYNRGAFVPFPYLRCYFFPKNSFLGEILILKLKKIKDINE